jgi:hypothetical protein
MAKTKSLEEQYPSVDIVYDIAKDSYNIAMKRLDETNDSFDKLRTWTTTLTLAFLALFIPKVSTSAFDIYFYAGLSVFILVILLTIIGKSIYGVIMPSPQKLYNTRLHQDKWTFKKDFIFLAGEDFIKNKKYVIKKTRLGVIIYLLFFLESALFGFWLTIHLPPP